MANNQGVNSEIESVALKVPSVAALAKLYKKAVASSDTKLAGITESAVSRIAIAEGAAAEAATLSAFAHAGSS